MRAAQDAKRRRRELCLSDVNGSVTGGATLETSHIFAVGEDTQLWWRDLRLEQQSLAGRAVGGGGGVQCLLRAVRLVWARSCGRVASRA